MRRPVAERVLAWIVLGPLGHLYSVVADVGVALAGYGVSRLRLRARRIASGLRNIASAGRGE